MDQSSAGISTYREHITRTVYKEHTHVHCMLGYTRYTSFMHLYKSTLVHTITHTLLKVKIVYWIVVYCT